MRPQHIPVESDSTPQNPVEYRLTVALLEDRPDALANAVALLHRRAFHFDSLAFGASERPGIVRLTLGMRVTAKEADRLTRELKRSVHVLAAEGLAEVPRVHRELLLVKVSIEGERRAEVLQLASVFRATTIDLAPTSISLELTGSRDKVDALISLLRPYGILELARTGTLAMARGEASLGAAEHRTSWLDRHQGSSEADESA